MDHVSLNFCKSICVFFCLCFFVVLDFNINCSHGNVQHRCLNTVWYRLKCVLAQWLLLSDVGLGCFGMVLSFSMSILKQMAETVAYYTHYIISNHISLWFCITQLCLHLLSTSTWSWCHLSSVCVWLIQRGNDSLIKLLVSNSKLTPGQDRYIVTVIPFSVNLKYWSGAKLKPCLSFRCLCCCCVWIMTY